MPLHYWRSADPTEALSTFATVLNKFDRADVVIPQQ